MPWSVAMFATTSLCCGYCSAIGFGVGTVRTQVSRAVIFMAQRSYNETSRRRGDMKIRLASAVLLLSACAQTPTGSGELPNFRADPNWPKPLAEEQGVQLVLGQVAGIAVNEKNGHVWIVYRPATLLPDEWNPKEGKPVTHRCCKAAAAVIEF